MRFQDILQFTHCNYTIHMPWDGLISQLERYKSYDDIDMSPEFQRDHVWTEQQRREYIEFVLQGGVSGRDIYWNMPGWMKTYKGTMQLVDGKQRLNSVLMFLNNELTVFDGHYYRDFEDRLPLEANFIWHVNDLEKYTDILNWYLQLNSGVVHTNDELNKVRAMVEREQIKSDRWEDSPATKGEYVE